MPQAADAVVRRPTANNLGRRDMACCGKTGKGAAAQAPQRLGCVLCKLWCIFTREQKQPGGDPCVVVPGHLIRKPDPCIYSQFLLMQMNQPVTWDNPDVGLFRNGVEQYTYSLIADTDYEVRVTVHNASRDKAANGTQVKVQWIEFGAGSQIRHPLADLATNVAVWPATSVVTTTWRTPATPGHCCIEVELNHPDDGNPANNRGWNNTQVHAAQSPVVRKIPIFNRYLGACPPVREGHGPVLRPHRVFLGWGAIGAVAALLMSHSLPWLHEASAPARGLALMLMGYLVTSLLGLASESAYAAMKRRQAEQSVARRDRKDRIDCHRVDITLDSHVFSDAVGKAFAPAAAFAGAAPVWPAQVVPSSFVFAPDEVMREVELQVDAPDPPGPPGHFNVSVWQGGVPSGGVTVVITTGGQ
jgi:hypothetical protein